MKIHIKMTVLFLSALGVSFFFGNCANKQFTAPNGNSIWSPFGDVGVVPSGSNSATGLALQQTHPALAVRGLDCMSCHGQISGANVVTDFGYGSSNFLTTASFFKGSRTAFNSIQNDGNDPSTWAWQSMEVDGGSIVVPNASLSSTIAKAMFGLDTATDLPTVLATPNIAGPGVPSMVVGVTPVAGQPAVIGVSSVKISYPTQAEILALAPQELQSKTLGASAVNVSGSSTSSLSGLQASGNYVTNSGTVQCYGDVVVKGVLFLNNLNLQTDGNGCRLYVSQTVFIQGPITYSGGSANSNLQITSSSAIIMGFSAIRLGAPDTGVKLGSASSVRISGGGDNNLKTPGGPWARFSADLDSQYNPGTEPINGVAPQIFFDNIVADALLIGSALLDAGDPAATKNLVTGETLIQDGGITAGPLVAIDYTKLLLNAPHIHSRYAGNFSGVIIGDVAMLARNPTAASQVEAFSYDPVFDSVPQILPALKTNILSVTK